jgi:hypothetical protein
MTEILQPTNPLFTADSRGLTIHGEIDFEQWQSIGNQLVPMAKSLGFIIGDWINYGEKRYGKKYEEAMAKTGLANQTLKDYAYVARKIESSLRQDDLDFSIHAAVAKLKDPEDQRRWLAIAAEKGLSVQRLRKSINYGWVVSEADMAPDPADRGNVTYLALVNRLVRWWKSETAKAPAGEWDEERREALRRDLEPLVEMYHALQ